MTRRALILMWIVLILIAVIGLTAGCTKTATITVDPGMNGSQPSVHCDVTVPNPDLPTTPTHDTPHAST